MVAMNPKSLTLLVVVLGGALASAGCMTEQARYSFIDKSYPARPAGSDVEVFTGAPPTRAFTRVARLDVHIERTYFVSTSLDEALPKLKEQARRAGSDAIVDIVEKRSSVGEAKVYHVTAIGIRYDERH
jgi:hypothetical protein